MAERPETTEMTERAQREIQLAHEGDDEARLAALETLLGRLEAELERDVGEAGAPRR